MLAILRRDGFPIVLDHDGHRIIMQQGCADCQAPFLKDELERVIHDIVHHLRNAVAVGAHQAGLGAKVDLHVERFFLNVVHPADEHATDEFVEVKIAQGQLVHALVHAA